MAAVSAYSGDQKSSNKTAAAESGYADASQLLSLLGGDSRKEDSTALKRKRNYEDLQCRGMYDQGIMSQLERICEDCYNLYKDAEVHGYCRLVEETVFSLSMYICKTA